MPAISSADNLGIGLILRCLIKAGTAGDEPCIARTEISNYPIYTCKNDPTARDRLQHSIEHENHWKSRTLSFTRETKEYERHPTRVFVFERQLCI